MVRCTDNQDVICYRRKVLADAKQNHWTGGVFVSGKGIARKWWPATFCRDASSATKQMEVQVCACASTKPCFQLCILQRSSSNISILTSQWLNLQLRVNQHSGSEAQEEPPSLHRTVLLDQNHAIFTLPSAAAAAYTIAAAKVSYKALSL